MREVIEAGRFRQRWSALVKASEEATKALEQTKRVLARQGEMGHAVARREGFRCWPLHLRTGSVLILYRLYSVRIELVDLRTIPAPGEDDRY